MMPKPFTLAGLAEECWMALLGCCGGAMQGRRVRLPHLRREDLDGRRYTKPSEASISAWRQWLSTHGGQETWDLQDAVREDLCKSRRLLYPVDENRLSTHSYLLHSAPWSIGGADLAFALREAVSKAVDTITAPSPGLPACSADSVAEQLLSVLEIAASKVAGMEAQMSSMKAYLQASEKQKQEAEVKLAEVLQINKKIQAKANFDAMEITRELRLKELVALFLSRLLVGLGEGMSPSAAIDLIARFV